MNEELRFGNSPFVEKFFPGHPDCAQLSEFHKKICSNGYRKCDGGMREPIFFPVAAIIALNPEAISAAGLADEGI